MARKKKSSTKTEDKAEEITAEATEEIAVRDDDDVRLEARSSDTVEAPGDLELDVKTEIEAEVLSESDRVVDVVDDPEAVKGDATADADDITAEASSEADMTEAVEGDETPEVETSVEPEPTLAPVREEVIVEKNGFFSTAIGGVVAAALGYGAAMISQQNAPQDDAALKGVQAQIADQAVQITSLEVALAETASRNAALQETVSGLSAGSNVDELVTAQTDQGAAIGGLTDRLAALEGQIGTLEAPQGASADTAAALQALQAALAEQRETIDAMSANAAKIEADERDAASATLRRAALTRVQTALDAGRGFAPALAELEGTGVEVPAALMDVAETGVASMASLLESLPDAARAALAVSRRDGAATSGSVGLGGFFRETLGVRSLVPREGADPDAVLSRVEAAVREGRLTDALAEIEGLPEAGRAELTNWSGDVARRLEAVAAAQELGEKLN